MFPFHRVLRSTIQFVLISLVTIALVLGWGAIAHSQLPALPTGNAHNPLNPPDGVTRNGEYETAPIRSPLDGKILFEVTSPTIFNRDEVPDGKLPVEIRAQEVSERLWRVFSRTFKAKQAPTVMIATLNNRPVLEVRDEQTTRPIRLVTVTEPDADLNGKTVDELAQDWQTLLQDEMVRFKQLASRDVIVQRVVQSVQILVGLLVASMVIWFLRRFLTRRQQTLEARYQEQLAALTASEKAQNAQSIDLSEPSEGEEAEANAITNLRSRFLVTLQHQFSVKRRIDVDKFFQWALFWLFILMWYVGIARIIATVPFLMRWSLSVWATPLLLLLMWFGISLAIRISKSVIDRVVQSWKLNPYLTLGESQRIALRTNTIAEALKGFIMFVLVIVGILWTLSLFNVSTSSILAGGAVIAFAISFGSQSLVKDLRIEN